ncbi:galactose mutarotase-like protein [Agrocybe pediades]|nr:galactose mutarotase-like protein [Agrocybe pediades]
MSTSEYKPHLITTSGLVTPALALEVLPHGLTIHKLLLQTDGRTHDIVIGPEKPEDHATQKYTNSIVGRYANRIPVGTHKIERNGITSELKTLANENAEVSLHGGPVGFDAVPWTLLSTENPPTLFSKAEVDRFHTLDEDSYAFFRLVSPSGDQGYPGTLIVEAVIALVNPERPRTEQMPGPEHCLGSVVIVYRAKLDGDTKTVTPINLTQHWGFNLEASLARNAELVKDHKLNIRADHVAELGYKALGTGKFIPVSSVPAHAHTSTLIGQNMPNSGYDDYYLFNEKAKSTIPSRIPLASFTEQTNLLEDILRPCDTERVDRPEPLVTLSSEKSGFTLNFDSNQHGVMFYSNALAKPTAGARKRIHGGSGVSGQGDAYGPGTAAFLEFHHPLAAFLYPENKDKEDTLLTSDELYHNYVRCDVISRPLPPSDED